MSRPGRAGEKNRDRPPARRVIYRTLGVQEILARAGAAIAKGNRKVFGPGLLARAIRYRRPAPPNQKDPAER